jgi:hypothetical protein
MHSAAITSDVALTVSPFVRERDSRHRAGARNANSQPSDLL